MKKIVLSTAFLVLMVAHANAAVPNSGMEQSYSQGAMAKPPLAKVAPHTTLTETWVLHDPYKPQAMKLTFVNDRLGLEARRRFTALRSSNVSVAMVRGAGMIPYGQ